MKKIINQPENVVLEMCNGIVMACPELEFIQKYKIIKKKDMNKDKVSLISGGGSGHEPAHAGFVGKGMLDAAICGDVFASPSQIQVYQAIKETASNKGTLMIIKNYSGDMMNFQNAAYLANEDGFKVDFVKVDDDIAVQDSLYTVGRRGVAGTVFVHKIAGAAAEKGLDLEAVKKVAQKAIANVRSIGFALTSCTVPAKGSPTFELAEDEMEYGVGIHGEPGIKREKMLTADELALRMTEALLKDLKIEQNSTEEFALLVNGFGSTPLQELYLLNNSVLRVLGARKILVHRVFVGNYMTSIDMAGASLSLLKLDDELKELLNSPSDAPAFIVQGEVAPVQYVPLTIDLRQNKSVCYTLETDASHAAIKGEKITLPNMYYLIDKMSEIIIANEVPFCDLDSHAGDGDFGMSIAKGFKELKKEWAALTDNKNQSIGEFLNECSLIIMEHCGGASGPIWGSAFRAAAKSAGALKELPISGFAEMLQAAVKGIQSTGERSFGRGAVVGDKTLIDALVPCANSWSDSADKGEGYLTAFDKASKASVEGAKATENIVARMGRAGTVGDRSIGYPDAGAYALGFIFTELYQSIK
ncbi:MAG: dihydroxyacetone kinase subunit DhaK [Mobilitalea sp.]